MKKTFLTFPKHAARISSHRFPGAGRHGSASYKSEGGEGDDDDDAGKKLLKELNDIKTGLEAKAKADAKAEVTEQLKAVNDEIEKVKKLTATLTPDQAKKMHDDILALTKGLEILASRVKAAPTGGPAVVRNMFTEFGEKLNEREKDLKEFRSSKKGFGVIELESKAVGNMASATSLTGSYFVTPTVVPGVQLKMYESVHMRDILPVGNTNSNVVRYVRDNGGEGGPTVVAEGAAKPQIDRDLEILDANVRKIATYFRVPEEMIDDIPYLQSFLAQIGIEEVMLVEDTEILYGDGTGQHLSGLFTNATAFAAGGVSVQSPNNFDVLLAAKKQGRLAKTNPSVALVSPTDFFEMLTTKDANNNYLFLGGGNGIDVQGVLRAKGLPTIVEHTSIEDGDFLVFDPRNAAIFDRTGTTVRFYDQDQDNAIKNLITIVIEKRLALPIFRTDGIIKGTFEAAKAAIEAA